MANTRCSKHFLLIGLCLFLASCASKQDKPADFKPAPDGPAGYATLYVFRPFDVTGSSDSPVTYIDGRKIVDLKAGSYTAVYLKPGYYHINTEESASLGGTYDKISSEFDIPSTSEYYIFLDQIATPGSNPALAMLGGVPAAALTRLSSPIKSLKWTLTADRYDRMRIRDCYYIHPDTAVLPEH